MQQEMYTRFFSTTIKIFIGQKINICLFILDQGSHTVLDNIGTKPVLLEDKELRNRITRSAAVKWIIKIKIKYMYI